MKKIALLSGGPGLEKEIAKKSATFFQKYITRDYDYYQLPEELDKFLQNKDLYNLAIPVFHGEYGEDGKIFAFLDILGIPHTFSKYDTHSLCLDKYRSNIVVENLGIHIPKQFLIKRDFLLEFDDYISDFFNEFLGDNEHGLNVIPDEILSRFPQGEIMDLKQIQFPVIIKPNKGGSSFHTYKIDSIDELDEKLQLCKKEVKDDILLQEFIAGEEYSIPVVSGEILPIMKLEKHIDDMFDYESKYENDHKIKEIFPEIHNSLKSKLISISSKIYHYFDIKGFSRIDFLVKDDRVYFLEINTIPGMTEASILPKSWKLTGRSFEELVDTLIKK